MTTADIAHHQIAITFMAARKLTFNQEHLTGVFTFSVTCTVKHFWQVKDKAKVHTFHLYQGSIKGQTPLDP